MRKLTWFTIGFVLACAVCVYFQPGLWTALLGLFSLLGFVAGLIIQSRPYKIAAVVLFGCLFGLAWLWGYNSFYLSSARGCDGQEVSVTVTAVDYSYIPNYGQAFDGYVELDGKRYQVRCYLNEETSVKPGDIVKGTFRLRFTPGEKREPTYHQGKGIFLLASQVSEVTITSGQPRFRDYPAIWRQKIIFLIESAFPEDTFGFAKALLLGDTTDLSYHQDRDFQVSGLRHVVAVSGLHVSILFALIYLAFGRRRVLNAVFGIPLLILFAAIAGFTPSVVRACLMQFLMLLALLADKEYDPPTALAFAALVILGINPMAITSVSFQLSVGCMIGIFAFSEPLRQYFLSIGKLREKSKGKTLKAKMIRWIIGSVAVTLSAMSVTTPLCAYYFGMVSLVGIPANLLSLWVISFAFYGIMISAAAAAVWLPLGKAVAWLISWPIRYVLAVSGFLADFPLAAVYTDSIYIVLWLIVSYALLVTFFLTKKKYPAITTSCICVLLCVCVALSWLEPRLDKTRVSVIDVGQGQSILLQCGKKRYLVDCGGEHVGITADEVANYLLSQGIFTLDGVILTHYDKDHSGSIGNLLASVKAEIIYMPDITDTNGIREQIEAEYPESILLISDISEISLMDGRIALYPGKTEGNDNNSSLCVLFQSENCDILITSDRSSTGERVLLQQAQLPKLELLVAGHHGANTATSLELLAATQPKAVAISVGAKNPYGHPGQELQDRLARFGCSVYRTDLQGTIIFRR